MPGMDAEIGEEPYHGAEGKDEKNFGGEFERRTSGGYFPSGFHSSSIMVSI
jgi:hypothetical protein